MREEGIVMVQELLAAIRVSVAHVLCLLVNEMRERGGRGRSYPGAGFPLIRPA
jgi:hypothetical protein